MSATDSPSAERVAQALAELGLTGIPIECGWGQPDDAIADLTHWALPDHLCLRIVSAAGRPVTYLGADHCALSFSAFKYAVETRFPRGLPQILEKLDADERAYREIR